MFLVEDQKFDTLLLARGFIIDQLSMIEDDDRVNLTVNEEQTEFNLGWKKFKIEAINE